MFDVKQELPKAPLYREEFEHDNCGIGRLCQKFHFVFVQMTAFCI